MSFILSSISSIANYVLKDLQFSELNVTIQNKLDEVLSVHQSMIEQIYISPLRTYRDYINSKDYESAAHCLMDLSNREATPKVNYLLAMALIKCGKIELAKQKIEKAISMNPFLDYSELYLANNYRCPTHHTSWSTTPYTITDSLANKAFRRMGFEINEGLSKIEVCSSGGDILYLVKTENEVEFGLLDIINGHTIWHEHKDNTNYEIISCTPEYAILKRDGLYNFYNRNSICVAQYSEPTFELLFSTIRELNNVAPYIVESNLNESTPILELQTLSTKNISITPIKHKKHKYWKTDGNSPHPGIDFDPVIYWAMNVRLSL